MNADEMYKAVQKMSIKAMNEKELIISEWLEMNGEKISEIINETYSFDDLKNKLEEYMILKDKATPKKPINRINYRTDINAYYCPNCNGFICNYYDKDNERDDYCCNCGQALDWSDE